MFFNLSALQGVSTSTERFGYRKDSITNVRYTVLGYRDADKNFLFLMKSLFLLRCDWMQQGQYNERSLYCPWMQVEADSSKYKSRCLRFTAMYLVLLNHLAIFFANSRVLNIRGVVIKSNKNFKHLSNWGLK